jgi:hypothetical protein
MLAILASVATTAILAYAFQSWALLICVGVPVVTVLAARRAGVRVRG